MFSPKGRDKRASLGSPTKERRLGREHRPSRRMFEVVEPLQDAPKGEDAEVKRARRERITWTVELAQKFLLNSTEALRELATAGIAHWRIPNEDRNLLHAIFGGDAHVPNALASNMALRINAGHGLINALLEVQRRRPTWRWYSFTFIDGSIRTKDRSTIIDLKRFEKSVRRLMSNAGLKDWVGVIEFLPYKNWEKGKGRDLAPHMHIVLTREKRLARSKLEIKMRSSGRLEAFQEAPTVTITERANTEGDVAHAAQYLLKGPDRAANAFRGRNGKPTQRDARQRNDQAVRVMEILSQFNLSELIKSSGKSGKKVRSELVAVIRNAARASKAGAPIARSDVSEIWRRARQAAGKAQYDPVTIIR